MQRSTQSSLAVGAVGFYLFLKTLGCPTQSWCYALALVAVTADVVLTAARSNAGESPG